MNTQCKAAFAVADITPDFEVELVGGWWPDPKTRETLHPLKAEAMVLEDGDERYCLVSVDSLGLTVARADDLRARLARRLGTRAERVMLSFTHTHEAPAPLSPVNGERYFSLLCDRAVGAAGEAAERLRPARGAWALTTTTLGENRRDGCTAVDDRLAALRVTDAENGAPLGVVLRATAHANILQHGVDGRTVISSDFWGPARDGLTELFGCPVLGVQGAAGNVKPNGVHKSQGGVPADVERVAGILVDSARRLTFGEPMELAPRMTSRRLTLIADVPSRETAEKIAEEAQRLCFIDGAGWLAECERLRSSGIGEQRFERELQCFFLAGGALCGVPDEIFCELALEAAKDAPLLLLNGYTNGCDGYLPSAEEWAKGGFEPQYSYLCFYAFHGHVAAFRQDTAGRIVAATREEFNRQTRP